MIESCCLSPLGGGYLGHGWSGDNDVLRLSCVGLRQRCGLTLVQYSFVSWDREGDTISKKESWVTILVRSGIIFYQSILSSRGGREQCCGRCCLRLGVLINSNSSNYAIFLASFRGSNPSYPLLHFPTLTPRYYRGQVVGHKPPYTQVRKLRTLKRGGGFSRMKCRQR